MNQQAGGRVVVTSSDGKLASMVAGITRVLNVELTPMYTMYGGQATGMGNIRGGGG